MADRQDKIAKLQSKLAYLRAQNTDQTRYLSQTTDTRLRQNIQENQINLLLEINNIKGQLRLLGINPPPPSTTASTSKQ